MTGTEMLGYAAAATGTVCWLPQVFKTLRSRRVADLSLGTNLLLLATILMWLGYGLLVGDGPLIVANALSALSIAALVGAKLAWGAGP